MENLLPDIVGRILRTLDARDLFRCKSVCKLWRSIISSPGFIKSHLKYNYINDRDNKEFCDQRILMASLPLCIKLFPDESGASLIDFPGCDIVGSCNGLVLISTFDDELFLINPETRETKDLKKPLYRYMNKPFSWGFGYDSSTDDYKVVVGSRYDRDRTMFQVLTLKSNAWKFIGLGSYSCVGGRGVLCNGAIHWLMGVNSPHKFGRVILSFDLCKEKFKEIHEPYGLYLQSRVSHKLGVVEGCICLYDTRNFWIMKKYNGKECWEIMDFDSKISYDAIHCLRQVKYDILHEWSFMLEDKWLCTNYEFIELPIFVKSLVSPHVNPESKRKREGEETSSKEGDKLCKRDPLLPGPSAGV